MIKPGSQVAAFRLPLSLTAFGSIADVIEHLYGAGETMLRMEGDNVAIFAPADGFGERNPELTLPEFDPEDGQIVRAGTTGDKFDLVLEFPHDQFAPVAESMLQWFTVHGGVNYIEQEVRSPEQDSEFVFTLQKKSGLTPHAARQQAEAKVAELERQLAAANLRIDELVSGTAPAAALTSETRSSAHGVKRTRTTEETTDDDR
ncbi:hypothetical protein ACFVAJ_17700 [Agromyces sp. NPDC057679]|uniref:hypothetical protein n=1 Tax=Agromyces sp. NPDC057679 TaxID=3346207 RepID=UPI003671F815